MALSETVRRAAALPQAGDLLAVEAIDRTGLIVTSDGALVRMFRVQPPNPLLMSSAEQARTAGAFQRLLGQLRGHETLQIYTDARPANLDALLADCRREARAAQESLGDTGEAGRARLY